MPRKRIAGYVLVYLPFVFFDTVQAAPPVKNSIVTNDLRVRPDLATSLNWLRYTDADLQAYKTGAYPYGHPDVDWQSQLLKKTSVVDRYSFNATGGNNFAKFFVALKHFNQQGLFKEDAANNYSANNTIKG